MALYDLAAKACRSTAVSISEVAIKKKLETDLTIGIDTPEKMAARAVDFVKQGCTDYKNKTGKNAEEDVERVQKIREAVGDSIGLRIDANQGWRF